MDDERPELAVLLTELMDERGTSVQQLARRSGVSRSTIYRWRKGTVSRANALVPLLRVARALGLDRVATTRLLVAAGQAPLEALELSAKDQRMLAFIAPWRPPPTSDLPAELTSFFGRERELLEIADLLSRKGARLVTLTGPGGSGKTRLARRVALELLPTYRDGARYVPLDELTDPDEVFPEIARRAGLREVPGVDPSDQLAGYFASRNILLVLDNFEHLLDAAPGVVELLTAAPGLAVLVTSRSRLHVSGEHVYPVAPFAVPPPSAAATELRDSPALALFEARARAADATHHLGGGELRAAREICARLDGIPLAIELAASRCGQFPVADLLTRFPSALALAADGPRDATARQRTLRDAIAWSYGLLDSPDRRIFGRLAVFHSGWDIPAAEAICRLPDDGSALDAGASVERLVAAALVQRSPEPGRFRMLQTIRDYAAELELPYGERALLAERHARYFADLASGSDELYVPGVRRSAGIERIEPVYPDLRAAMVWARDNDPQLLARLCAALWPYWHESGQFREGRAWLDEARAIPDLSRRIRAQILTGELLLAYSEADIESARETAAAAVELWDALGDHHGLAIVKLYAGQANFVSSDIEAAGHALASSLDHWRELRHRPGMARCMTELAVLMASTQQTSAALHTLAEAGKLFSREGLPDGLARCLVDQGLTHILAQNPDKAIAPLEEGIALAREIGAGVTLAYALFYLGVARCFTGDLSAARPPLEEALRLCHEARDQYGAAYTMLGFAALASRRQNMERAARLAGAAMAMLERTGIVMNPGMILIYDQEIAAVRAQLGERFPAVFGEGLQLSLDRAVSEALGE